LSAAGDGGSRLAGDKHLADLAIACLATPPRAGKSERDVFSSDLTVDEAILLAETGFRPRRLVIGCSIFHVGWATTSGYGEGELVAVTKAMSDARTMANRRLLADAQAAGGEIVVGVRLTINSQGRHAEFMAVGTAIGRDEASSRPAPIATDLSGQDFYLLNRAGYEPIGLVFGNCVYYAPPNWGASFSTSNVELDSPTRALTRARELAMARLQHEAEALGAAGVVGVTVTERSHAWWRGGMEFLAVGTAVRLNREAGRAGAHRSFEIKPVVELEDVLVKTDPAALSGRSSEAGGE
jgi:uncharacterized protein YbjQ (UPF0145 family)